MRLLHRLAHRLFHRLACGHLAGGPRLQRDKNRRGHVLPRAWSGQPGDERKRDRGEGHQTDDGERDAVRVAVALVEGGRELGPDDAGHAPRNDHRAVDRTGVLRAEVVRRGGRHGAEAAAVTDVDQGAQDEEQRDGRRVRQHQEGEALQRQHADERRHPADPVAGRCPDDASGAVEESEEADGSRCGRRGRSGDGLEGVRRLRDQRQATGGVEREDGDQQVPLAGVQRLAHGVGVERACRAAGDRGDVAGDRVPRRWVAEEAGADQHGDEVGHAEGQEHGRLVVGRGQQRLGHRCGEHAADAEAADRDAGDQPAAVREPLHQHGDGGDVARPQSDAAHRPVGHGEQPQLVGGFDQAGEHDAEGVQGAAGERDDARTVAILHPAPDDRADEDGADRHHERQHHLRLAPPELLLQRLVEHAPRVDTTERELNEEGGGHDRAAGGGRGQPCGRGSGAAERGQITGADVDEVAAQVGIPRAHVYGTTTFFEELSTRRRGERHVQVCAGTACFAASHGRHLPAVERALGIARGATSADGSTSLQPVYCLGYCYGGPAALDSEAAYVGPDLVDQLTGAVPRQDPPIPAYAGSDTLVLLAGILGGDTSWRLWPALQRDPDAGRRVREEVAASGLRGRGGAGFPVAQKWAAAAGAPARDGRRYLIVNGDEGDPGSYIDRLLLQRDPHRVLEGLALGALACGATRGYIYVRSEYPDARDAVRAAVQQARAAGHVGDGFDVEVVEGAGSYVAGEETSLIHSLEGLRGGTLARPPVPTEQGLFQAPTVVNNVESIATVPWIVEHGGSAYAALGRGDESGQRLVCVNAGFQRPGVYEVPLGVPLRHVVSTLAGGLRGGARLRSLQIGGPLGGFLDPHQLDLPLSRPALAAAGVGLGHASMVGFDDTIPGRAILKHIWRFAAAESCGTCTPCRVGSRRGLELSRRLDVPALEALCETLRVASLCAFGPGVAQAVRSILRVYSDEFWTAGGTR